MAVRRADAIRSGVAAADHDDVLAGGHDLAGHRVARDHLVLLRQELHREVHAGELPPRHRQVARPFRATREHDRVELREERLPGHVVADVHTRAEQDALGRHLCHAPVDQRLLHLEVRDPVAEQPADAVALLEDDDVVPGARELLRAGKTRGPGADHGNAAPGLALGGQRHDPAFFPALVDDEVLDRLDAHCVAVDVQRARGLARRGADAAGELGEVVGRVQHLERLLPLAPVDQVVPVGNDVVDRAAALAERDAAVHAPRALLRGRIVLERQHELAVVPQALRRRLGRFLDALQFEKPRYLAHTTFLSVETFASSSPRTRE